MQRPKDAALRSDVHPALAGYGLPATRPTRAEIDLAALAHNLGVVRAVVEPARVYAVVKADAYGHGLVPVADRLARAGVDGFCVALVEEGLRLRAAGIRGEILVLNGAYGHAHREVIEAGLTPVVFDARHIERFASVAGGAPVEVHLKIDTGMSRLGILPSDLPGLVKVLDRHPQVRVTGAMTHLASADTDPEGTRVQLAAFEAAVAELGRAGHIPTVLHAANSAGALCHVAARYDLVRTGLALYGLAPAPGVGRDLRPAMQLRSEVIALREVPAGTPVGYDGTFHTRRPSRIATVPIGYGDGLLRAASNRGEMLVRGRRCPIIGAISMDLTCLDVTDLEACELGDDVAVFGEQQGQYLSPHRLAEAANTIAYEVLTSVSPRVPRVYG